MVRFTIWSSHSPQTLLMLYRRMDEMISTAGFVTGKAKSFAVSSVPGFITLSVWDWHRNQRGTGFVLNVRSVSDEWMHSLPGFFSFLFLPHIFNSSNHQDRGKREISSCFFFLFLPYIFNSSNHQDIGKSEISCLPPALSWSSISFLDQPWQRGLLERRYLDSSWIFGSLWDPQPSLL